MLINLRNALMAGKRLPYDAEVEWINGSGAYVDTGVNTADDVGFRVTLIRIVNTTNDVSAFGARASTGNTRFFVGAPSSGKWYFGWNDRIDYGSIDINTPHTLGLNFLNNRKATFDDSEAGNLDGTIAFSRRLFFPGYHRPTGEIDLNSGIYYKFCGCQITKGGVLVRDFIPVRVGTVGYMYDRVSGKLFGNAGTGDFVLGPDVVPVEYIESHWTEWIDTGYVLSASDRIVVRAYFHADDSLGSRVLCGVGNPKLWITTGFCRFNGENSASIAKLRRLEAWNSISIDKDYCTCNGTTVPMSVGTFQDNSLSLWLFGANGSTTTKTNGRIASCKIYHSGTPVRSFRTVRVGTGSTWEGAMMDTLTRRIYRNAGTGAFTYGNDLEYPIPAS